MDLGACPRVRSSGDPETMQKFRVLRDHPAPCNPEAAAQVPDEELVERVTGRRLDPETGEIYHLRFKPPPEAAAGRLVQRSDDTEDKLRTRLATHHANVAAVVGYYKDVLVQVRLCCRFRP